MFPTRWSDSSNIYSRCDARGEQCLALKLQGYEFAHRFSERITRFFVKKWANKRFVKKNKQFAHSLICSFLVSDLSESLLVAHFWWATWAICSHCSFLVSDLSNSLTSLLKKEVMCKSLVFYLNVQKTYQKIWFYNFSQIFWANRSFAHLSWETWANRSQSLIFQKQPEQFAHSRSFDMSDLSDSLTVAHLSWVIWANRSQSLIWFERSERMSEFPAL